MKKLKIISVCGSGTISSAMISQKLQEVLKKEGFMMEAVEVNNGQIMNTLNAGNYDCICYASPISGEFPIPCISAIGLLTGIGEEEVYEKVLEVARNKA